MDIKINPNAQTVEELTKHINTSTIKERALSSQIVILPEAQVDGKNIFQPNTVDFSDYLTTQKISHEIASTEDDFEERLLHSADIWLPTLLFTLKEPSIAITLSVVANYIYDRIKGKTSTKHIVHSKINIQSDKNYTTIEIEYHGPPEQFETVALAALQQGTKHND